MMFEFDSLTEQKAKLKVVGVGGAGGNAVTRMITSGMQGVGFIAIIPMHKTLTIIHQSKKYKLVRTSLKGLVQVLILA